MSDPHEQFIKEKLMAKAKFERNKPHVNVGTIGHVDLSLIHISEPTRHFKRSRMPSSA